MSRCTVYASSQNGLLHEGMCSRCNIIPFACLWLNSLHFWDCWFITELSFFTIFSSSVFLFFICRLNGWKCYNQKHPIQFFSHLHVPEPLVVLRGVLKRMRFQVYLQDVTTLTAFRRDGHPSVYRKPISIEKSQKPGTGLSSDCSHWCLPGVPDIWNEMLSAWL